MSVAPCRVLGSWSTIAMWRGSAAGVGLLMLAAPGTTASAPHQADADTALHCTDAIPIHIHGGETGSFVLVLGELNFVSMRNFDKKAGVIKLSLHCSIHIKLYS